MSCFDFFLDEVTGYISKTGHYSHCRPHEASREEDILWRRVEQLVHTLDEKCSPEILALLKSIPEDAGTVHLNPEDFAIIRQQAWHRVRIVTDVALVRRRILGELRRVIDGSPTTCWIVVARDVPRGTWEYREVTD